MVFRHPLAGKQLVKGTIEEGEHTEIAALRELREESGIEARDAPIFLGKSDSIAPDQTWYFFRCETAELPNSWTFHTGDDGGHLFDFFWHRLDIDLDAEWDERFKRAVEFVRIALL